MLSKLSKSFRRPTHQVITKHNVDVQVQVPLICCLPSTCLEDQSSNFVANFKATVEKSEITSSPSPIKTSSSSVYLTAQNSFTEKDKKSCLSLKTLLNRGRKPEYKKTVKHVVGLQGNKRKRSISSPTVMTS